MLWCDDERSNAEILRREVNVARDISVDEWSYKSRVPLPRCFSPHPPGHAPPALAGDLGTNWMRDILLVLRHGEEHART